MSYDTAPMQRMPVFFGPSLGPRQGPDGTRYANKAGPAQTTLSAAFETDTTPLEEYLPDGFELLDTGWLTATFSYIREIDWLAGRGYNVFGLYVPARYRGAEETVEGDLNLVLWENMADPIITGREELGIAKLYCELPELRRMSGTATATASWGGFQFADLVAEGLRPSDDIPMPTHPSAGLLHYKYMPRTGEWGDADIAYATLTPAAAPNFKIVSRQSADTARLNFNKGSFAELPTLVHVIDLLSSLNIGACLGAELVESRGYKDLRDQRIVR